MTKELDERSPDEEPYGALRSNHVDDDEDGEHEADSGSEQGLEDKVTTTETEQSFVPEGGEQLLATGVRHKLYTTGGVSQNNCNCG